MIKKLMKWMPTNYTKKSRKNHEQGQALLLVLVLLMVGILIITSSLMFMGTTLKTNKVYVTNTTSLYSAEAGIQDGIWDMLNLTAEDINLIPHFAPVSPNTNDYSEYDYITGTNIENIDWWGYSLSDPTTGDTVNVNTYPVNITFNNTWVPLIDDNDYTGWIASTAHPLPPDGFITPPSLDEAIGSPPGTGGIMNNANLLVTGTAASGTYTIKITAQGAATSLPVISIGCWLPQGFTYNNSSSNLQGIYSTEQVIPCAGNEAVVWTFTSKTYSSLLASLLQTGTIAISFGYTASNPTKSPQALAWMFDNTTANSAFPYRYAWDGNVKVHNVISSAGVSEIEAYIPQSATRLLGTAMNGDYVATGNSLLTMASYNSNDVRTNLLSSSSATVANIPPTADLQRAYLYWTGWYNISSFPANAYPSVNFKVNHIQVYFDSDGNAQTGPWVPGLAGTLNQNKWNGPTGSGYSYSCYRNVTDLVRKVLGDAAPPHSVLPGNATYEVGPATGWHMADTGGTYQEWAYAGWSLILVYSGPSTLGHQIYVYDTFTYADNVKDIDITGNTAGPGGVISGFLVPQQDPNTQDTDPLGVYPPGNPLQGLSNYVPAATITACVGDGDFCYDTDFIAINAPSTYWVGSYPNGPWSIPANSVYRLWDGITLPSPYTSTNTSTNKNNVWNSYSQTGLSEGIDIKTFTITWESGLIHAGDTSARIDVPTSNDSWSFIYMILSFRSLVTSGGSVSYIIRKRTLP